MKAAFKWCTVKYNTLVSLCCDVGGSGMHGQWKGCSHALGLIGGYRMYRIRLQQERMHVTKASLDWDLVGNISLPSSSVVGAMASHIIHNPACKVQSQQIKICTDQLLLVHGVRDIRKAAEHHCSCMKYGLDCGRTQRRNHLCELCVPCKPAASHITNSICWKLPFSFPRNPLGCHIPLSFEIFLQISCLCQTGPAFKACWSL